MTTEQVDTRPSKPLLIIESIAAISYAAKCQQHRIEFLADLVEGSLKSDLKQLKINQQNIITRILKALKPELRADLEQDLEREEIMSIAVIMDRLSEAPRLVEAEADLLQAIRELAF